MKLEKYELTAGHNLTTFEFTSRGEKGEILKLVQFTQSNQENLFNLAFGDKDLKTGELDDLVVSNNGDSDIVLATVMSAIYIFTDTNPNVWIYATGSTKSRTRLYQIGISKYLAEAEKDFILYGQIENEWREFEVGVNYEAFVVKRKFNKLRI